jgi:exonuclease SbcD
MLRIIHTADWHLGKMLGELSREQEHQMFLDFLLSTIRNEQADVLLIAGDVFDSANPPQSAVALYYNFLSRLHQQCNCQVIITAGNHDSPAHLEAPKELLKQLHVHVVGHLPENINDLLIPFPSAEDPRVIIAAVPFLRDRDLRSGQSGQSAADIQQALGRAIAACYQSAADNASAMGKNRSVLIAMGHLTVSGASSSDSERDIHIGGLGAVSADCFPPSFDYVALGHLHRPQRCGKHEHIRYAGSPLPLSFSEANDSKELRMLEIDALGRINQRCIVIPLPRILMQVKTNTADVAKVLGKLAEKFHTLDDAVLKPWLELLIDDPVPGDNMVEKIAELTREAPFSVIRILNSRSANPAEIGMENLNEDGAIDTLLNSPAHLFQLRLDQEENLSQQQKEAVILTFGHLLSIHQAE